MKNETNNLRSESEYSDSISSSDSSSSSNNFKSSNYSVKTVFTPSHVESKKTSFNMSQKSGRRDSFRDVKIAQNNILTFCQEGSALNFYKGGSTVPLVSGIYSGSVRNDNIFEVLDRLKFLTRECFHINEQNEHFFRMILNELEMYMQCYQNENEDSDWDSDQECVSISIISDLK